MLLHLNKISINSKFIKTLLVEILEHNYWVTTTVLIKVNGNKYPFQSESDTSTGMLAVLALNTCTLKKPQAVLSSPKWEVLCLGNKSTCFQEIGSAQLHWYQCCSLPVKLSVPASHLGSALKAYTGERLLLNMLLPSQSWESSPRHRGLSRDWLPRSPESKDGGF